MTNEIRVPAQMLEDFISEIFEAAGAGKDEARAIGANLTMASLTGHDSHGVVRTPRYLMNERAGTMVFGQTVEAVIDRGAFALLDGRFGFGQTVGHQATEDGIVRARQHGVAVVALRNAGHLGRIGAWAELAIEAGLVSIHFVNVANSMLVAPFGGAERRFSTAPVCVGIPNPGGDFLLDFATSCAAEGKILVAMKGGRPPPPGALIDGEGQPSADPEALYGPVAEGAVPDPRAGPGALTAMGDHKGSGLAFACELLAGALTGSGTTSPGSRVHNGMLSIYADPDRFDDGFGWGRAVADYVDFVRSARPADPAHPVLAPGDAERIALGNRMANGVPLSAEIWASLVAAGEGLGVKAPCV
ncbi:MAG: Ldh family oxidoreductase [Pseudomonadota bacterium]